MSKTKGASKTAVATTIKSDMVKHELRVKSCEVRVTSYELKIKGTGSNPQVTSSNPQIIKSVKTQVNSLKIFPFPKVISPKLFGNS